MNVESPFDLLDRGCVSRRIIFSRKERRERKETIDERLRRGLRRLDAALSNTPLKTFDKPGSRQSPAALLK
ncbi:MAG: hypothetical protein IKW80_11765 [Thermoguttaceae bacterium]|nr:hypothetical protein [Thermoguttaceae bacterium]